MLASIFRKPKYKSFSEEVVGKKLKCRSYIGTKAINVNKIVGSVSRCQRDNTLSINKNSQRYQSIKKLLENMAYMPPIKVYRLNDEYYIVDGHHRVEASKEIGKEFLDAEVIEYRYH